MLLCGVGGQVTDTKGPGDFYSNPDADNGCRSAIGVRACVRYGQNNNNARKGFGDASTSRNKNSRKDLQNVCTIYLKRLPLTLFDELQRSGLLNSILKQKHFFHISRGYIYTILSTGIIFIEPAVRTRQGNSVYKIKTWE